MAGDTCWADSWLLGGLRCAVAGYHILQRCCHHRNFASCARESSSLQQRGMKEWLHVVARQERYRYIECGWWQWRFIIWGIQPFGQRPIRPAGRVGHR